MRLVSRREAVITSYAEPTVATVAIAAVGLAMETVNLRGVDACCYKRSVARYVRKGTDFHRKGAAFPGAAS